MGDPLPPVLARMKQLGHAVFESGAYNLNLFGIRSPDPTSNSFDDLLGCAYRETSDGPWRVDYWRATTDPGVYYREHPMRVEGTAILVPGQYRGAYELGLHRGKYEALVQTGAPVKVWRDSNCDDVLDWSGDEHSGWYGINLHASAQNSAGTASSSRVDKWSAGCQVHGTQRGFDAMMRLAHAQIDAHPTWTRFTYTLLEQWW